MSRLSTLAVGASTLVPAAYVVAMLVFIFTVSEGETDPSPYLPWVVGGALVVTALLLAQMVGFITHAIRSTTLSNTARWVWAIALLKGTVVAAPAYWILHIYRDPQA